MDYPLSEKLYYKKKIDYETEYLTRFNSISTIKFDILIKDNQAFIVVTPELLNKLFLITKLNDELFSLTSSLLGIALNQFIKKCLIEEIVLTNEMEGVISTRRDISEILEKTGKSKSTMDKMGRGKYVLMEIIDRLCVYFDCDVMDIITHTTQVN